MFYSKFSPCFPALLRSNSQDSARSHTELLQTRTRGYCYEKQQLQGLPGAPAREKPTPRRCRHPSRALRPPAFERNPQQPHSQAGGPGTADPQLGSSHIPPATPAAVRSHLSFPAQLLPSLLGFQVQLQAPPSLQSPLAPLCQPAALRPRLPLAPPAFGRFGFRNASQEFLPIRVYFPPNSCTPAKRPEKGRQCRGLRIKGKNCAKGGMMGETLHFKLGVCPLPRLLFEPRTG